MRIFSVGRAVVRRTAAAACVSVSVLGAPLSAHAAFDITVVFSGSLGLAEQAFFNAAETYWESVITGYAPGISLTGLTINASGVPLDGIGNVLGSAGPSSLTLQGGYFLATAGNMQFDTADIPGLLGNGSFGDVIRHEMAHVLGFGTLWTPNFVSIDGTGKYTGVNALSTYQTEYGMPLATFVPIELTGGPGTENGHWSEVNGGGTNTGILDQQGRDKRFELMTGWLDTPAHVSLTTVASFQDIGYTVNLNAVPEPAAILLLLAGIPLMASRAAKHRRFREANKLAD